MHHATAVCPKFSISFIDWGKEYRLYKSGSIIACAVSSGCYQSLSNFDQRNPAQFGVVLAIRTLNTASISKGQEIFLHYGYTYSEGPKWYKDSFRNYLMHRNETDNEEAHHLQQIRKTVFFEANITTVDDASNMVLDKLLNRYRDFSEKISNIYIP